ncbi:MAG TPA: hypothetical protein VMZ53_30650 [Kofleriaceae bacterium]|nr:hypothetical protein [Kofleriaceae bacterium]
MDCNEELSSVRYDVSSATTFNRLEIRLDGRLAAEPTFFEGVTAYHYEHDDVFATYYDEIAITAFVDDAPIAAGSAEPAYRHDGMVHIAEGVLALQPLPAFAPR